MVEFQQVIENIIGTELNLFTISSIITAIMAGVSVFVIPYLKGKITKKVAESSNRDEQISAQTEEINDMKKLITVLLEVQAVTIMASKGLDPTIKSQIASMISSVAKPLKISELATDALQKAVNNKSLIINEEIKQDIIKESEEVKKNLEDIKEEATNLVDQLEM